MLLDILIPSNGQLSKLQPLMESISSQTLLPDRVVVLIHKVLRKEEQELLLYFLQKHSSLELAERIVLITNLTADYEPGHWRGHDRNVLLKHAKAKFVYMIDHDNEFGPKFFEKTADRWMKLKEEEGKEAIISPTIMWRKTPTVQSQGITGFSFLIPKYRYKMMGAEPWQSVKMMGGNSLFGLRDTFEQFPFDRRFGRCYEDIDMTYRVSQAGIPLIVLNKVEIQHMESPKNKLQKIFLGDPATAFERARNRIWFVKKNATPGQKIQYFGLGLWGQTFWFLLQILVYGGKERVGLWKAVVQGTREGLVEN